MTSEELAKLCIESYVEGHKNAIQYMRDCLSNIEENQKNLIQTMINTMTIKLENK